MLNKIDANQAIESGDECRNTQYNNCTIVQGVSRDEVKRIFNEQSCEVMAKYAEEAKGVVLKRVDEIFIEYVNRMESECPNSLVRSKSPDFQYVLNTALNGYAKTGNATLKDMLIDFLIEFSKNESRSLYSIVVDESVSIIPKLTESHLSILSFIFCFRYRRLQGLFRKDFIDNLSKFALPVISGVNSSMINLMHLQYSGCLYMEIAELDFNGIIKKWYLGLFSCGFTVDDVRSLGFECDILGKQLFYRFDDCGLIYPAIVGSDAVDVSDLSSGDKNKYKKLLNQYFISIEKVRDIDVGETSLGAIMDLWNSGKIKTCRLTSVGMAIGHANLKRLGAPVEDIRIWMDNL